MDSSKLKAIFVAAFSLLFALYLGIAAATAQKEMLVWIGGGAFLAICLLLGKHIWILIPASLGMKGVLNFLPGSPAPWHLITAVVAGFTVLRILTRQQRIQIHWTGMETAIALVGLTVLQAALRNPVGLHIMGGDSAGSKPYFVFAVAFVAYFLVSNSGADFKTWRWAVIAYIMCSLIDASINVYSAFSPTFAANTIRFYSNVSELAVSDIAYSSDISDTRIDQFSQYAGTLGLIACTFWRPLGALNFTKPWQGIVALAALVTTFLSGFRTVLAVLAVYFTLGSILRRKPFDAIISIILGIVLAAVVAVLVPNTSLPYSVERIFSIIPGYNASSRIQKDTEGSKDFRFEMWELALTSDKYIKNKWLGDGFQFSADEYNAREAMRMKDFRMTGGMNNVDMFMITGAYHGFHVETIRFTGVVGLIAATSALFVFMVFGYRNIKAYRDQPGWGHVLFICMPALIGPWWAWLVFAEYRGDFPLWIAFSCGMIKLLHTIHKRDRANLPVPTGNS